MAFFSTRGESCVIASQAVLRGLAPDGGLYVPAMFPAFTPEQMSSLYGKDYAGRAADVLKVYLEDYTSTEIEQAVRAAYSPERFDDPRITPLKKIDDSTWIMELFHGPTLAFKDIALQLLPHLMKLASVKNGEQREVSILVATSGDTGKAALEGFRDVEGTSCTVFYPLDGVSDVQKLQMVTTGGKNTHVIAVRGNFDDAQTGVKELFASESFTQEMNARGKVLSSANSINFGRLVPQIVYYFSAYADLVNARAIAPGDPINFCVPTGNFGDILAGYYASLMGLPVNKFICASNTNNVLTDFINTGTYDRNRKFYRTISPSMDILVSSNLERLLYEKSGHNSAKICEWMKDLAEKGSYSVGNEMQNLILTDFFGTWVDEIETKETIGDVFNNYGYVMDPHTAVAYKALEKYRLMTSDPTYTIVLSTASPFKFNDVVLSAIAPDKYEGKTLDPFEAMKALSEISKLEIPPSMKELPELPVKKSDIVEPEGMEAEVCKVLGI